MLIEHHLATATARRDETATAVAGYRHGDQRTSLRRRGDPKDNELSTRTAVKWNTFTALWIRPLVSRAAAATVWLGSSPNIRAKASAVSITRRSELKRSMFRSSHATGPRYATDGKPENEDVPA